MFTGLIRALGEVREARAIPAGRRLVVATGGLPRPPAPGDSVCVSGVCLTAVETRDGATAFDAIPETLQRTTLGGLRPGDRVNLEPSLRMGDPLDGHLVAGHVDAVGEVVARGGPGVTVRIRFPRDLARFVAPKGSLALDGISLTVVEAGADDCTVALIPETLARTTAGAWAPGARVNVEVDLFARYVARVLATKS